MKKNGGPPVRFPLRNSGIVTADPSRPTSWAPQREVKQNLHHPKERVLASLEGLLQQTQTFTEQSFRDNNPSIQTTNWCGAAKPIVNVLYRDAEEGELMRTLQSSRAGPMERMRNGIGEGCERVVVSITFK